MSLRLAIRALRRVPWYAATSVGTIALSISLAATVFAVVDGVLFKPLPYPAADRLFYTVGAGGPGEAPATLAPADVRYLAAADPRVAVAAYGQLVGLTQPSRPDLTIWSARVDSRFFDVLGQHPHIGGFTADHYNPVAAAGDPHPAIVSHGFWRQWLAGDLSVVGRTVDMVGRRLTIVGVLPHDFVFPTSHGRTRPDVLLPLEVPAASSTDRWSRSLTAIVRLDGTFAEDEARTRLSAALAAHAHEYLPRPEMRPGPYVAVWMRPLETYLGAGERPLFRLAFGGAALLVLLGAVNVAGLFAARNRDRERELAIRVALGAERLQLARLMLMEALVIAALGGLVGVAAAGPMLTAILAMLPASLLLLKPPVIDWRVVSFAVSTACLVVTAVSLAPTVTMARRAVAQRVSAGATSTRVRSWSRGALLAAESAMGICLVVAGSLVLASFIVLRAEDPGFAPEGLAVLEVRMTGAPTRADVQTLQDQVIARLRQAPRISAVATLGVPLLENMFGGSMFESPPGARPHYANDVPVSGPFFDVARLTLLDGRLLTEAEIEGGQPLAVVSELTARAFWPERRAVGEVLIGKTQTVTVVGVVEEARFGAQDDTRAGEIYLPGSLSNTSWKVYLLRTGGDPDVVVREAALLLHRDVAGVLVRRAESFESALWNSVRLHRFRTVVFGVSAAAGLLLVAVGIGGLVATGVARRVREIGIRHALGASRPQLVRMLVVDYLRPSLAGVALGLLASWWTTRLLDAFLYRIDAHNPAVWAAAALGLLLVAASAAWIPARRASAVDPMVVLKAD